MNEELVRQRDYWNREITQFEAIYSRRKNFISVFLDRVFRKDMYDRFVYTLRNAEPIKDRTVLDVGCGTGRYIMALLQRGCGHATGIDISEQMIGHCRAQAAAEGFAGKNRVRPDRSARLLAVKNLRRVHRDRVVRLYQQSAAGAAENARLHG